MKRTALAFVIGSVTFATTSVFAQDGKSVAAIIGDKKIHVSELMDLYNSNPQFQQVPFEAIYENLLMSMAENQVIISQARAEKLQETKEFKEVMKTLEEPILRKVYLEKLVKEGVSEKEIDEQYKKFVKENPPEEQVHARHILVENEADANQVIAELKKGADFVKLARDKSIGPSAMKGGDVGYFPKEGAMVSEFSNAAFDLKVGEFSQKPVNTQFGWHVIKVEDRKVSQVPKKEEVLDALRAEVAQKKLQSMIEKANVKYFDLKGKPIKKDAKK